MNKNEFKKIALLGIVSGLAIGHTVHSADKAKADTKKTDSEYTAEDGNMGYYLMTDDDLKLELNGTGLALYNKLDSKGKELARFVASQRCNGTNKCEGLNACKTDKNECAGKGSCEGKGKCAFSDKNLAVKVVSEKLAKKRQALAK